MVPDSLAPLDTALVARAGDPIGIAVAGAGWLGKRVAVQVDHITGLKLRVVANRSVERAAEQLRADGFDAVITNDLNELGRINDRDQVAVVADPHLAAQATRVDAVIETTGDFDFGTRTATAAIAAGKHVVIGAELDATIGPELKRRADEQGVVATGMDGDEPAVNMNLLRLVRTMGLQPVMAGNIKGFLNHYRDPETQIAFAATWGQNPRFMASFADGTKLASECAILGNATGFGIWQRGMRGFEIPAIGDLPARLDASELLAAPKVDYAWGAAPGAGGFVVAHEGDEERSKSLHYLKMGEGPLHVFTRPFHLPHLEVPLSAARAVLWHDAAITALGAPVLEVIALAKRTLEPGEVLDGVGGFAWYGLVETAAVASSEGLLPMGLAEGATVTRRLAPDTPIRYDDVEVADSSVANVRRAQDNRAFPEP
ncbi:MAG: SAF domain-containing protein [Acidimicrobiia bacterium]